MTNLSIIVDNCPPVVTDRAPKDELDLFKRYMQEKTGQEGILPFEHQAETFQAIARGSNVLLVAGTAAGKTLAVAIPVFAKLLRGDIQKAMFLYPTIALLEDQLRVLSELGEIINWEGEIGYIQGGMTRSKLLQNLSKKVIVATPDSVYWFFRKNIKYSSLLIYGLCQVDEFVMDEAHIFNGLSLQNLKLFFERIEILKRRYMQKSSCLHILTATPRSELSTMNRGQVISGRSKSRCVSVSIRCVSPYEKLDEYKSFINEAVKSGYKKILVIANSAVNAHRLFFAISRSRGDVTFSPEEYFQFGRVEKKYVEEVLRAAGIEEETIENLYERDREDIEYYLRDFNEVEVFVSPQKVFDLLKDTFHRYKGKIHQVLYFSFKKRENVDFNTPMSWKQLRTNLRRRSPLLTTLLRTMKVPWNDSLELGYFEWKQTIKTEFDSFLEKLENAVDSLGITTADYPKMSFIDVILTDIDDNIVGDVKARFADGFRFKISDILQYQGRFPHKRSKYIYLKWLKSYFDENSGIVEQVLSKALRENLEFRDKVKMHHVGVMIRSDYPVIVYSGSMSKRSRQGLINLFDGLEKAILISTSAVEVGVDFSADLLITEECEAGSFLQRFGRVGRAGSGASCWLLVSGRAFGALKEEFGSSKSVSREDFSQIIARVFKSSRSLSDSDLVKASYIVVNRQLGLVGEEINKDIRLSPAVLKLSSEMAKADINLHYGLRGTLPSVSMKDEGVTKNLFQLLQFIPNQDLEAAISGFELAKANVYFTSLLYKKRLWEVFVDVEKTIEESQTVILSEDDYIEILVGDGFAKKLYDLVSKKYGRDHLLIFGDIFLKRREVGGYEETPVQDKYGEPLTLPDQFCLIFPGVKDISNLDQKGLSNIEEIYYDVDFHGKSKNNSDLVLLDNIQGACLALYRLLDDINKEAR